MTFPFVLSLSKGICSAKGSPLHTLIKGRIAVYHLHMIDWSSCASVESDPGRLSGAWVFRGTRVPVAALFKNLEDGAQASQFVEWFPGVTLEQVRAVLEHAARSALAPA